MGLAECPTRSRPVALDEGSGPRAPHQIGIRPKAVNRAQLSYGGKMTKDEIIRKKQEYIFNCAATYFKDPMVIDHAKGQYIWDIDGKQFLDFLGGIVTVSVGHSNPRVTDKIKAQIDKVQHLSLIHISEPTRRTPISYAVF